MKGGGPLSSPRTHAERRFPSANFAPRESASRAMIGAHSGRLRQMKERT